MNTIKKKKKGSTLETPKNFGLSGARYEYRSVWFGGFKTLIWNVPDVSVPLKPILHVDQHDQKMGVSGPEGFCEILNGNLKA